MTSVYSFCSSPSVNELKSVGQPSTPSSFAIYSPHSHSHQSYLETETVDDDDNSSFFVYSPTHLSDSILSNFDEQQSDIANSPSDAEKQIIQICSSSHGIPAKASQTHVLYHFDCCPHKCLKYLSFAETEHAKSSFDAKATHEQNQYLLDYIHISSGSECTFCIEGKKVCQNALCSILGVSSKRYKKLYRDSKNGVVITTSKCTVMRESSMKYHEAVAWMSRFFNSVGDRMPHLNQIHLPHFLTRQDVYKRMVKELHEDLNMEVICLSHFYRIWRKKFRHVVIPAVSSIMQNINK